MHTSSMLKLEIHILLLLLCQSLYEFSVLNWKCVFYDCYYAIGVACMAVSVLKLGIGVTFVIMKSICEFSVLKLDICFVFFIMSECAWIFTSETKICFVILSKHGGIVSILKLEIHVCDCCNGRACMNFLVPEVEVCVLWWLLCRSMFEFSKFWNWKYMFVIVIPVKCYCSKCQSMLEFTKFWSWKYMFAIAIPVKCTTVIVQNVRACLNLQSSETGNTCLWLLYL